VPVAVEGHGDGRVTQVRRQSLCVHAGGDHGRGVRVPELVEADRGEAALSPRGAGAWRTTIPSGRRLTRRAGIPTHVALSERKSESCPRASRCCSHAKAEVTSPAIRLLPRDTARAMDNANVVGRMADSVQRRDADANGGALHARRDRAPWLYPEPARGHDAIRASQQPLLAGSATWRSKSARSSPARTRARPR
jgi:hypothetical protein